VKKKIRGKEGSGPGDDFVALSEGRRGFSLCVGSVEEKKVSGGGENGPGSWTFDTGEGNAMDNLLNSFELKGSERKEIQINFLSFEH